LNNEREFEVGQYKPGLFLIYAVRVESKARVNLKVGLESFCQLWHIVSGSKYVDLLGSILIKPN